MGGRGNSPMRDLTTFQIATKKRGTERVHRPGRRNIHIRDAEHRNLTMRGLLEVLFDLHLPGAAFGEL
jgi:hypothetical protein